MIPRTKIWHNPTWLLQQHWMEELSLAEMARMAGCSPGTISWTMRKFSIPHRRWVSLESRFWSKVDLHSDNECWEWQGAKSEEGYGNMALPGPGPDYKHDGAHRVSWQIHNGPIPKGLCVLHKCDNASCVNPKHLFLGTKADNNADMRAKGRQARGAQTNSTKLVDDDVIEIRRLREEDKLTLQRIADTFDIGLSTVGHIIRRETWTHL